MKKKIAIVLAIILLIVTFISSIIFGQTYTYKIDNVTEVNDINNFNITFDNEDIVKIVNKKIDNNRLIIKLKSIKKGKTGINISSNDESYNYLSSLYVNSFGIITIDSIFGKFNGCILITISIIILIIYSLIVLIYNYKNNVKDNLYQYKNISYLGLILFLISLLLHMIITLVTNQYSGLVDTLKNVIRTSSFSIFLLVPITFVVSILVTISNINLVRREGKTWRNMLGIILSIFFIAFTILPDVMYRFTFTNELINIHNMNSIDYYIYQFIESTIYIVQAYIVFILIGTIIIGIKSAKRIPKYDKDYIIILGCMIKKDGSLTPLLKGRVDKAIEFSKKQKELTGKDIIFVPSGGQGSNEVISEGEAMYNYLISKGINKKQIILEDKSKTTFENLKFSNKLINNKKAKIAFSTTNYHVFRAGIYATSLNMKVEGIGAKTKAYFWVNAFIREFIATIVSRKKSHIFVILVLFMISILSLVLEYLSIIL
jgi:vancomycin permeability regulator SanA